MDHPPEWESINFEILETLKSFKIVRVHRQKTITKIESY